MSHLVGWVGMVFLAVLSAFLQWRILYLRVCAVAPFLRAFNTFSQFTYKEKTKLPLVCEFPEIK